MQQSKTSILAFTMTAGSVLESVGDRTEKHTDTYSKQRILCSHSYQFPIIFKLWHAAMHCRFSWFLRTSDFVPWHPTTVEIAPEFERLNVDLNGAHGIRFCSVIRMRKEREFSTNLSLSARQGMRQSTFSERNKTCARFQVADM